MEIVAAITSGMKQLPSVPKQVASSKDPAVKANITFHFFKVDGNATLPLLHDNMDSLDTEDHTKIN